MNSLNAYYSGSVQPGSIQRTQYLNKQPAVRFGMMQIDIPTHISAPARSDLSLLNMIKGIMSYFFTPTRAPDASDLIRAIGHRDLRKVQAVLSAVPESKRAGIINHSDSKGYTPFLIAVAQDDPKLVQCLFSMVPEGADRVEMLKHADSKYSGYTALHSAVSQNSPDMLRTLLAAVPESERAGIINQSDSKGYTPFLIASDPKLVQCLFSMVPKDADRVEILKHAENERGYTALHLAVIQDKPDMLRTLLAAVPKSECAALINQADHQGGTLLSWMITCNRPAMLNVFLEKFSGTERVALINEHNLLHIALVRDNPEMVGELLNTVPKTQRAAIVNQVNSQGASPFFLAVRHGNPAMLQALLVELPENERREVVNQTNRLEDQDRSPLQVAVALATDETRAAETRATYLTIAGILLAYGADASILSDAERNNVLTHAHGQMNEHLAKVLNPNASPGQVRHATRMFQWTSNNTIMPYTTLEAFSGPVNQFLVAQLKELAKDSRLDAIRRLKRLQPALRLGVSCNQAWLDALTKKAVEIQDWRTLDDILNAGASHRAMVLAIKNHRQPVKPEATAGSS